MPWFLSPFPASYRLFGNFIAEIFVNFYVEFFVDFLADFFSQVFLLTFMSRICRVFDRLLLGSKPKWLPLSFLLYLLSKRGQVRL